jgi:hypothetical protein
MYVQYCLQIEERKKKNHCTENSTKIKIEENGKNKGFERKLEKKGLLLSR